jgi:hypothetical protein
MGVGETRVICFLAVIMQKTRQPRSASRRDFVRNGFRHALLAGLGAVSLVLFKRSGGKLTGQTCINQGICSGCTAYTACALPQALSRKQAKGESPS